MFPDFNQLVGWAGIIGALFTILGFLATLWYSRANKSREVNAPVYRTERTVERERENELHLIKKVHNF